MDVANRWLSLGLKFFQNVPAELCFNDEIDMNGQLVGLGGPMDLDRIDTKLISLLTDEPRSTHRALADGLGLSESNVASRLARLEQSNVIRVMAMVDREAVGYAHHAVFGIRISGRLPDDVAAEIVKLPEANVVHYTFGRFHLVVTLLARDKSHLAELLEQTIGSIPGVQDVEVCLTLDVQQLRCDVGKLALFGSQRLSHLPDDHTVFDDLDLGIIEALQENGRTSFREISRRLDAPNATIRSRVSRLEQLNSLRLVTIKDVDTLLPDVATAYVALRVSGGQLKALVNKLCEDRATFLLMTALGRFNLIGLIALPSRLELMDMVAKSIAPHSGVQHLEVWEIVRSYKHDLRIAADIEACRQGWPIF